MVSLEVYEASFAGDEFRPLRIEPPEPGTGLHRLIGRAEDAARLARKRVQFVVLPFHLHKHAAHGWSISGLLFLRRTAAHAMDVAIRGWGGWEWGLTPYQNSTISTPQKPHRMRLNLLKPLKIAHS
jgi:hypothetical protein